MIIQAMCQVTPLRNTLLLIDFDRIQVSASRITYYTDVMVCSQSLASIG